jgi:hypothetical protein
VPVVQVTDRASGSTTSVPAARGPGLTPTERHESAGSGRGEVPEVDAYVVRDSCNDYWEPGSLRDYVILPMLQGGPAPYGETMVLLC